MLKYIAKRIGLAIVTIWAVATITFFLMNMVPGGPFLSEKAISPQATAALEAKYGLDKPLFQQYLTYIGDALHGDLGDSLKQRGRTVRYLRTGSPDARNPPWLYRSPEEREVFGQSDQCSCNLRDCGSQLCNLHGAPVFFRC